MLSVSEGISVSCESYEQMQQCEADFQAIITLPGEAPLDWATWSQLVVSVLQFPNSESLCCSDFHCGLFLLKCVAADAGVGSKQFVWGKKFLNEKR